MRPTFILLWDNDPALREATALMLGKRGGRVRTAADEDELLARSRERVFDVAVVDVEHPDRALELMDRLRKAQTLPRRAVLSTAVAPTIEQKEQFSAVLLKPYAFDRLLRAVFEASTRRPTRSGVFARIRPAITPPRGAAPSRRDPG